MIHWFKKKRTLTLKAIAAIDNHNGIGYQGDLLYKIPADMKYFIHHTGTDPVIMRRGTFESFGGRPLPRRMNIVITRDTEYDGKGAYSVETLDQALEIVKKENYKVAWIIGGAGLYAEALPLCHELHITQIYAEKTADTFFPVFTDTFTLTSESEKMFDEKNGVAFQFQVWRKK
jgi:dihydrofolate reductase